MYLSFNNGQMKSSIFIIFKSGRLQICKRYFEAGNCLKCCSMLHLILKAFNLRETSFQKQYFFSNQIHSSFWSFVIDKIAKCINKVIVETKSGLCVFSKSVNKAPAYGNKKKALVGWVVSSKDGISQGFRPVFHT